MIDPRYRASDDDRLRVVAALERHTAAGRLSLDEFSDRVARALASPTHGELAAVTSDLPTERADPADVTSRAASRQLLVAFLLAMAALAVLAAILFVAR